MVYQYGLHTRTHAQSVLVLRFTDTILVAGLAEQMKGVLVMARRTLKLLAGGNEDGCVVN